MPLDGHPVLVRQRLVSLEEIDFAGKRQTQTSKSSGLSLDFTAVWHGAVKALLGDSDLLRGAGVASPELCAELDAAELNLVRLQLLLLVALLNVLFLGLVVRRRGGRPLVNAI